MVAILSLSAPAVWRLSVGQCGTYKNYRVCRKSTHVEVSGPKIDGNRLLPSLRKATEVIDKYDMDVVQEQDLSTDWMPTGKRETFENHSLREEKRRTISGEWQYRWFVKGPILNGYFPNRNKIIDAIRQNLTRKRLAKEKEQQLEEQKAIKAVKDEAFRLSRQRDTKPEQRQELQKILVRGTSSSTVKTSPEQIRSFQKTISKIKAEKGQVPVVPLEPTPPASPKSNKKLLIGGGIAAVALYFLFQQ